MPCQGTINFAHHQRQRAKESVRFTLPFASSVSGAVLAYKIGSAPYHGS
jgi:hypothetical protein